jgi:hypothetical protein
MYKNTPGPDWELIHQHHSQLLPRFINMSVHFLLGTFRHPHIFTLALSTTTGELTFCASTPARGGHSWLHVSDRKLYCTVWGDEPILAAYDLQGEEYPIPRLINTARIDHLSGYVTANAGAVFSASGPQVDALTIDGRTGGFTDGEARQSMSLVGGSCGNTGGEDKGGKLLKGQLAFGGLRHGGHVSISSPGSCVDIGSCFLLNTERRSIT